MNSINIKVIVLPEGVSPISNILANKSLHNFCETLFLLTPSVYESLENCLYNQMGSRQNTKYGKISGTDFSIAISYDENVKLHKIDWISTSASTVIYNAENQHTTKAYLYKT